MAVPPIITWHAPEYLQRPKQNDWYWSVGIITLALVVVAVIFGNIIPGLFVLAASVALVIHASRTPKIIEYSINDRGVVVGDVLYPFLTLDSFWIPHDEATNKLIIKSRKLFMPFIVIIIDEVDPENIREILLRYIAETEHQEPILKHILEWLGF